MTSAVNSSYVPKINISNTNYQVQSINPTNSNYPKNNQVSSNLGFSGAKAHM
jgi:hypothetical protein